uniref:Uncharacterized protein n=1 Tax=Melanopsichium pennsylvanicum 4 TaxID=1398559 RepID=A0A077QQT1_9BASI|nr:uncharacterized protein BN887_06038 [Melanopsichium pennsylvanicum 4]
MVVLLKLGSQDGQTIEVLSRELQQLDFRPEKQECFRARSSTWKRRQTSALAAIVDGSGFPSGKCPGI